jgi:hypothetical protein
MASEAQELIRFLVSCIESGKGLTHEDYVRIGRWQRQQKQQEQHLAQAREDAMCHLEQRIKAERENKQAHVLLKRVQDMGLVESIGRLALDIDAFLAQHQE